MKKPHICLPAGIFYTDKTLINSFKSVSYPCIKIRVVREVSRLTDQNDATDQETDWVIVVCLFLFFALLLTGSVLTAIRLVKAGDLPPVAVGIVIAFLALLVFYVWLDKRFGHKWSTGGYHYLHRSD